VPTNIIATRSALLGPNESLGALSLDLDECVRKRAEEQRTFEAERDVEQRAKTLALPLPLEPKWDTSPDAVRYNNVADWLVSRGLTIIEGNTDCIFGLLAHPSDYEPHNLWAFNDLHTAAIIDNWLHGRQLSPPVFIRPNDRMLVTDGKHRLRVARASGASKIMFMLPTALCTWINDVCPSSRIVGAVAPNR
jgi:hypothetical protein